MAQQTKNKFVYYLGNTMYINLTNKCTSNCVFCIRNSGDTVGGVNLILEDEKYSPEDIIKEIANSFSHICNEIVFCGYGEPLIKLDELKKTAEFIKKTYPNIPVRINTNGHANIIHKRNIAPELVGLIDRVSVSLNAHNPELYAQLTGSTAYEGVKIFIKECVKNGLDTTATVVSGFGDYKINLEKCREISETLGAKFRIREWLSDGY